VDLLRVELRERQGAGRNEGRERREFECILVRARREVGCI